MADLNSKNYIMINHRHKFYNHEVIRQLLSIEGELFTFPDHLSVLPTGYCLVFRFTSSFVVSVMF